MVKNTAIHIHGQALHQREFLLVEGNSKKKESWMIWSLSVSLFFETARLLSRVAAASCVPPATNGCSWCSAPSPALGVVSIFHFVHSNSCL